jgi:curved DNA-binding protein CbpA
VAVSPPNYYDVLGVDSESTDAQIHAAWRVRVSESHPDRFAHSERTTATERTTVINEAYQTLSDPTLRTRYDASVGAPTIRFGDPDAAVDALLSLRRLRRTERLKGIAGGALGIAAALYTIRSLELL